MHLLPATPNPPTYHATITPAAGVKGRQIMEDVLRNPDRRARTTAAVAIRRLWTASVFPAQAGACSPGSVPIARTAAPARQSDGFGCHQKAIHSDAKRLVAWSRRCPKPRGVQRLRPNPLQQQGAQATALRPQGARDGPGFRSARSLPINRRSSFRIAPCLTYTASYDRTPHPDHLLVHPTGTRVHTVRTGYLLWGRDNQKFHLRYGPCSNGAWWRSGLVPPCRRPFSPKAASRLCVSLPETGTTWTRRNSHVSEQNSACRSQLTWSHQADRIESYNSATILRTDTASCWWSSRTSPYYTGQDDSKSTCVPSAAPSVLRRTWCENPKHGLYRALATVQLACQASRQYDRNEQFLW